MSNLSSLMIKAMLFFLGFISMSFQILYIREALAIFNGNELVIGFSLASWMMVTALGAYLSSLLFRNRATSINGIALVIFFLLLLPLGYFMPDTMAYMRSQVVPSGLEAGLGQVALVIVVAISPFCLFTGGLFTLLAGTLSEIRKASSIHTAYALDSAGSIFGGILLSIVIFSFPGSRFQVPGSRFQVPGSRFQILNSRNASLYPGQEVLESRDTPYGRLTVTRMGEQYNLYENGIPILLAGEPAQREEMVHYAMLMHPQPRKVLMISGGIGGTIAEVFKYSGVHVYYVESNPWLIDLVNRYIPFPENSELRIIKKDPGRFLQDDEVKYDVILLNTPDPGSAELNRFYTREFFTLLKKHLNPDGILSSSTPAAGNYMSEASILRHSIHYNTLTAVFKHIRLIPGYRDYFLASDGPLDGSLWINAEKQGIPNLYVNPGYIDEEMMRQRSAVILKALADGARVNTDLRPSVYYQVFRQWLDKFDIDHRIIPVALIILLVTAFILLGPLNLGLFTGGFTVSSLEFILLLWLQVLFGNLYQVTGLVFALFMAGLALGSIYQSRMVKIRTIHGLLWIQGVMAIFALFVAGLMTILPNLSVSIAAIIMIGTLIFFAGILMGVQYAASSRLRETESFITAGESFSADLFGSATGMVAVSACIIPLLGLPLTAVILSGLNILVILIMVIKRPLSSLTH